MNTNDAHIENTKATKTTKTTKTTKNKNNHERIMKIIYNIGISMLNTCETNEHYKYTLNNLIKLYEFVENLKSEQMDVINKYASYLMQFETSRRTHRNNIFANIREEFKFNDFEEYDDFCDFVETGMNVGSDYLDMVVLEKIKGDKEKYEYCPYIVTTRELCSKGLSCDNVLLSHNRETSHYNLCPDGHLCTKDNYSHFDDYIHYSFYDNKGKIKKNSYILKNEAIRKEICPYGSHCSEFELYNANHYNYYIHYQVCRVLNCHKKTNHKNSYIHYPLFMNRLLCPYPICCDKSKIHLKKYYHQLICTDVYDCEIKTAAHLYKYYHPERNSSDNYPKLCANGMMCRMKSYEHNLKYYHYEAIQQKLIFIYYRSFITLC